MDDFMYEFEKQNGTSKRLVFSNFAIDLSQVQGYRVNDHSQIVFYLIGGERMTTQSLTKVELNNILNVLSNSWL